MRLFFLSLFTVFSLSLKAQTDFVYDLGTVSGIIRLNRFEIFFDGTTDGKLYQYLLIRERKEPLRELFRVGIYNGRIGTITSNYLSGRIRSVVRFSAMSSPADSVYLEPFLNLNISYSRESKSEFYSEDGSIILKNYYSNNKLVADSITINGKTNALNGIHLQLPNTSFRYFILDPELMNAVLEDIAAYKRAKGALKVKWANNNFIHKYVFTKDETISPVSTAKEFNKVIKKYLKKYERLNFSVVVENGLYKGIRPDNGWLSDKEVEIISRHLKNTITEVGIHVNEMPADGTIQLIYRYGGC